MKLFPPTWHYYYRHYSYDYYYHRLLWERVIITPATFLVWFTVVMVWCVSIFFSNITLLLEISARRKHKEYPKSVLSYNSSALLLLLYLQQTRSSWMMISYQLISFLAYLNKTKVSVVIVVLAIAPSYNVAHLQKSYSNMFIFHHEKIRWWQEW